MSERWKIEDHGEYFDVTAPNGGNAAFFGGTGDYIGRFAYFAICQLIADLRERDERIEGLAKANTAWHSEFAKKERELTDALQRAAELEQHIEDIERSRRKA